jgi:acyl-coenzyme A synthetase/AMP-(fatty) acid ligase
MGRINFILPLLLILLNNYFPESHEKGTCMELDLSQKYPDLFNLADYCIGQQVGPFGNKLALISIGKDGKAESWTYQELWDVISRLAAGFSEMGLPPRSRILIHLPSSPDYLFVFFAAILAGHIAIPAYEKLTTEEVSFIIKDSECSLMVTSRELETPKHIPSYCKVIDEESLVKLKQSPLTPLQVQTQAEDPAILVFTSGTTKDPKGVLHAQRMVWGRRPTRKYLLDISEHDIILHTDTLNFTYTIGAFFDAWASGATALLFTGNKTPHVWLELIKTYGVTIFMSCPSTYVQILETLSTTQSISSLRHCISAGEAIKEQTIDRWQELIQVPLYEALGMTEINLFISNGPAIPRKRGTIGKPQPSRQIAVLPQRGEPIPLPAEEIGLLAVHRSDPGLLQGYWHRPEEEKEHFIGDWFLTGDLVHQDKEGYIHYHGRIGTILNIDSDVVSPQEVEAAFENHPEIQEVGCWSVQENDIPLLAIFVVLKKDHSVSKEEILEYSKSLLADYKCPKKVYFLEELPRDSRGKLLRRELRSTEN